MENFSFNRDDDFLRIAIAVDAAGLLSGQVKLGRVSPPAPVVDPTLPWPVDFDLDRDSKILWSYVPGFVHTARDIHWENQRLRFSIAHFEPWQAWCSGQRSYEIFPGHFGCVPFDTYWTHTDGYCRGRYDDRPFDCDVALLCTFGHPICVCDVTGCSETLTPDELYDFDIALRNGTGEGSVRFLGKFRLSQVSY